MLSPQSVTIRNLSISDAIIDHHVNQSSFMKYGAHCYIFTDRWADNCLYLLDQVSALGLDCFEISVGDDVHFNAALTRRHAEELGIELIVSPGAAWPKPCDLSSEVKEKRKNGLVWHKRQVDLTAALGATAYTGALYGHTGVVKKRRPQPDEFPWMAEGLHALAAYGDASNVEIVIEPMSHFRTHLVNTPSQAMRLIEIADHQNLGVLIDTYHMVTEITDYAASLRLVGDRLWGVHACENNRGVPGRGIVPWNAIFRTLKELQFDGYLMLESYNSSIDDFAFERGMFHDVCPDAPAFVDEGMNFLKQGLSKLAI